MISSDTQILKDPIDKNSDIINFEKGTTDKYYILGDNIDYDLIKTE